MLNLYLNTIYIFQYVWYIIFFVVSLFLVLVILQNYRSNEFILDNNNNSFSDISTEKKCHINFSEELTFGNYSPLEIKEKGKYIYFGEFKKGIIHSSGELIVYIETKEGYDIHSFQVNLNEGKVSDVCDFFYSNLGDAFSIVAIIFFIFIYTNNSESSELIH